MKRCKYCLQEINDLDYSKSFTRFDIHKNTWGAMNPFLKCFWKFTFDENDVIVDEISRKEFYEKLYNLKKPSEIRCKKCGNHLINRSLNSAQLKCIKCGEENE